ncbi:hypothetical protein A0H81_08109 [Grifola frondosa]|uniref:Uncharacterized protein n=1 Tax=Grifola frondosa TaxID=5627 RepID=A0A1C7M653_GRIFR|nr:hypothetical protein A0H81_08109 [Grifola frondosa]
MGDSLKDVQNQLESQRVEFESRLQAIAESNEAEDLKAEKEQMEHQLKLVQTHMKLLVKEANVVSKELGKDVLYNFAIAAAVP